MTEQFLQSMASSAGICHPDCIRASNEQEDYDASQTAALIAVSLISSARVILKLDTEYTEYSAQYLLDNIGKEEVLGEVDEPNAQVNLRNILQYLVENVWTKKEDRQGEMDQPPRRVITVKDCFEFAFKKGLPRSEHWAHVGCTFKAPPFACQIPRVPMRGKVIEAADIDGGLKLMMQQPVGARLHLFSPEFDTVGEEGIYDGPAGEGTRYVGLRDCIIVAVDRRDGKNQVTVQILYKKKTSFVNVSITPRILPLLHGDDDDGSQVTEPTCLLVDFCIPRLSVN